MQSQEHFDVVPACALIAFIILDKSTQHLMSAAG